MANITPSRRAPFVPPIEAIKFGLPVTSGTLVPLADGFNSLFGWRCLRTARWTADYNAPLAGTYLDDGPQGTSGTLRLWLTTSDVNEFGGPAQLGALVVYQAKSQTSQEPSIEFELYKQAGAAFRDAIIFRTGDGSLSEGWTGNMGARVYPLFTAWTPFFVDDSATDAANPTTPRLMNLDAADTRTLMEVRVNYANARPLFVTVFEAYRPVLPQ